MNSPKERIGFIGIGSMGWPMATRLVQAGFDVTAFDARPGQAEEFATQMAVQAAPDCATLARQSDLVFTMLPTSAIVEQVLNGQTGVLAGLRPGSVVIDMSSGVPAHTRRLAELVAAAGSEMVDAPSPVACHGRAAANWPSCSAVPPPRWRACAVRWKQWGSIMPTGDVGSAHAMKALNNLVSAGGFLIGVEAMLIGQQFGLDPDVIVDVLNASTGMNNSTQKKFKQFVLSRKFDSGFGLDLMVKDLGIALDIGANTGTPTPFASLCRDLWASAAKVLGNGQDHTAVARLSERLAGAELRSAPRD